MRFVLIRHGQSTNNLIWAQTGADHEREIDPRLTPLGEEQAHALGDWAATTGLPWTVTHLYASAMARAIQTAAPLADALDLPLRLHPDLFEVGGPYDHLVSHAGAREQVAHPGSSRDDLAALSDRLDLPDWVTDEGWWRGEVERELAVYAARADRVVRDLRAQHADTDVVALVSHGWFGNVLICRLLGINAMRGRFELANTAITLVEDADDDVPWDAAAIRVNWMPHLRDEQVSDSLIVGTTSGVAQA